MSRIFLNPLKLSTRTKELRYYTFTDHVKLSNRFEVENT